MFLLQIHLYISTVVEVCECADALCTLQHVRDTMQEKWKDMSDRIASGDFDADTNAMRLNEIVKKYPGNSLIHRLELGKPSQEEKLIMIHLPSPVTTHARMKKSPIKSVYKTPKPIYASPKS